MEIRAKAVGYCRVSTEAQAVEGISLEAQEARIKAWAEANGYELVAIHVDAGLSGGKASNRPGLQASLTDACRLKAVLVVHSLSRLARSTKDALSISERLDKAGADLVSLSERIDTTSAAGKMIFRMLAVLAEFERDQVSERTAAAMAHLKAQRKRVGAVPFGFDEADGCLISNEQEQATLVRLKALRAKGMSYQAVANELNHAGIQTKNGRQWHGSTVFYVCNNSIHQSAA